MSTSSHKKRYEHRRAVMHGYPVARRNFSYKEVKDYLLQDRITCLICGQKFLRLAGHLNSIHEISVDDYKEMYGLPFRTGLVCLDTREKYSQALKARIDDGSFIPQCSHEVAQKANRRKPREFFKEVRKRNSLKAAGLDRSWCDDDFKPIIKQAIDGRLPLNKVFTNKVKPSYSALYRQLGKSESLRLWLRSVIDKLEPFDQVKIQRGLSDVFWGKVAKMRARGKSDATMAKHFGIDTMTINIGRKKRGIS